MHCPILHSDETAEAPRQREVNILTVNLPTLNVQVPSQSFSSTALDWAPELPLGQCKEQPMPKSRGHPSWCPQWGATWECPEAQRKRGWCPIEHFSLGFEYLRREPPLISVQRLEASNSTDSKQ